MSIKECNRLLKSAAALLVPSQTQDHRHTLTDYEASVSDSLEIVGHFPGSLLPSVPNLLEGPDKNGPAKRRSQ